MNECIIPSERELSSWLEFISLELKDFLPPYNASWAQHMRSCFETAILHPDRNNVSALGARIFYKITKNHRLVDGNKRSAVICVYLFFVINGCRLELPADHLYALSKGVAEGHDAQDEVIKQVADAFAESCSVSRANK